MPQLWEGATNPTWGCPMTLGLSPLCPPHCSLPTRFLWGVTPFPCLLFCSGGHVSDSQVLGAGAPLLLLQGPGGGDMAGSGCAICSCGLFGNDCYVGAAKEVCQPPLAWGPATLGLLRSCKMSSLLWQSQAEGQQLLVVLHCMCFGEVTCPLFSCKKQVPRDPALLLRVVPQPGG